MTPRDRPKKVPASAYAGGGIEPGVTPARYLKIAEELLNTSMMRVAVVLSDWAVKMAEPSFTPVRLTENVTVLTCPPRTAAVVPANAVPAAKVTVSVGLLTVPAAEDVKFAMISSFDAMVSVVVMGWAAKIGLPVPSVKGQVPLTLEHETWIEMRAMSPTAILVRLEDTSILVISPVTEEPPTVMVSLPVPVVELFTASPQAARTRNAPNRADSAAVRRLEAARITEPRDLSREPA